MIYHLCLAIPVGSCTSLLEPVDVLQPKGNKKKSFYGFIKKSHFLEWTLRRKMPAGCSGDVSVISFAKDLAHCSALQWWCWGFPYNSKKYQMCSIFTAHKNVYGLLVCKKKQQGSRWKTRNRLHIHVIISFKKFKKPKLFKNLTVKLML